MPPTRNTNTFIQEKIEDIHPSDPIQKLGIVLIFIFSLFSFVLYAGSFYLNKKNDNIEQSIKNVELSMAKLPLQKMVDTYSQISNINTIITNKNNTFYIFEILGGLIENEVYIEKLDANTKDKNIEINIIAVTNLYENVAKQMDSLKRETRPYSDIVKNVNLKSVSIDQDKKIKFNISLEMSLVNRFKVETEEIDYSTGYKKDTPKIEIKFSTTTIQNVNTVNGTNTLAQPQIIQPIAATPAIPVLLATTSESIKVEPATSTVATSTNDKIIQIKK
jgi:hypothetical protein